MPTENALRPEHIKTLRFIAEHPLVIEEDSDNFYSADYLNVCRFVEIEDGAWHITHSGRVLLATLDAAQQARDAEINEAAAKLRVGMFGIRPDGRVNFWSGIESGEDDPEGDPEVDGAWANYNDAANFLDALAAANQSEKDEQ